MDSSKQKEDDGQSIIENLLENEENLVCSECSCKIDFNGNFVFTNDSRLLCTSCFEHSKCN